MELQNRQEILNQANLELESALSRPNVEKDDYQKYLDGENSKTDYRPKKTGILSTIFFLYLNKIINLGEKKRFELDMLYKVPNFLKYQDKFPKFREFYTKIFQSNPKVSFFTVILRYQFWMWMNGSIRYMMPFMFQLFLPMAVKYYLKWLTEVDSSVSDTIGILSAFGLVFISFMKATLTAQAVEAAMSNSIVIEMLIRVSQS